VVLISSLVSRPASCCAISTIVGEPICLLNDISGQLHAPLTNIQPFIVDTALTGDDVEMTAWCRGCDEMSLSINGLLKTAESTTLAGGFPVAHFCGNTT
jgi:hypothetical protein